MSSQVKFYKGMTNAQAKAGTNLNNNTADNGGILFSAESNNSGRIYTKDLDGSASVITEYYKTDLEFTDNKILATDFGLKSAGYTITAGTRVMDLLKAILFKKYLPKYIPATLTLTVSGTPLILAQGALSYEDLTIVSNPTYVEIGSKVKVTGSKITITGTVAKSRAEIGSTYHEAVGGQFKNGSIGGTSISDITGLSKEVTASAPDDATSIDAVSEYTINYLKNTPNISVTFNEGTTPNELDTNKSRNSDGELVDRFADDFITEDTGSNGYTSKNGTTPCVNSNYNIAEVTVSKNVTLKDFKVRGYYPIYYLKTIEYNNSGSYTNGVLNVYTSKLNKLSNEQLAIESKIDSVNNVKQGGDTITRIITGSDAYTLENIANNSYSYLVFCGPQLPAGDTVGYRFILPSEYSIDELYAHDLLGNFGSNLLGGTYTKTNDGNNWSIKCSEAKGALIYLMKIKRVIPNNN